MEYILHQLSEFVILTIEKTGYFGIFTLMALESANIPIPSEVIMPFSGFLASQGKLNLMTVVFWGAMGNLIGSIISYYAGFFGGRVLLEKYGKFILISKHDLDLSEKLFSRYGDFVIFGSRVLPVIRTFISFPAGIAKMNIFKFSVYTFAVSFVWSFILAYVGVIMEENWDGLEVYFRKFDWAIVSVLAAGFVWWAWRHFKILKSENAGSNNDKQNI